MELNYYNAYLVSLLVSSNFSQLTNLKLLLDQ